MLKLKKEDPKYKPGKIKNNTEAAYVKDDPKAKKTKPKTKNKTKRKNNKVFLRTGEN